MVDVKAFAVHRLTNDDRRIGESQTWKQNVPALRCDYFEEAEETLTKKTGGMAEEGF
jgi:hypothetical protein